MGSNLTHLPLVNNQNKLVDYAINLKLNIVPGVYIINLESEDKKAVIRLLKK